MELPKDDESILSRISRGDLKAYRILFDRYFSDLCNFLFLYVHNKNISEEIAVDIFAYIWEKRESLEIKSSVKSFLFAAAKNRAISHYRQEKKSLFSDLQSENLSIPEQSPSPNTMEVQELRELIQKAIDHLPEKSRQVYLMAWEENLSHKEIAQRLGLTPKTVENHVGIALRKLREALKPYYEQIFLLFILILSNR